MEKEKDFLDELIQEFAQENPYFPDMVDATVKARMLMTSLGRKRRAQGLSQTEVAARMATSQSALARIESGETDPRITSIARFAGALGYELVLRKRKSST